MDVNQSWGRPAISTPGKGRGRWRPIVGVGKSLSGRVERGTAQPFEGKVCRQYVGKKRAVPAHMRENGATGRTIRRFMPVRHPHHIGFLNRVRRELDPDQPVVTPSLDCSLVVVGDILHLQSRTREDDVVSAR